MKSPKMDYNQQFNAAYDVTKLTAKPAPGKAGIDAFFTAKGSDMYAILPRWPERRFTVKNFDGTGLKSATLLGVAEPLRFQTQGTAVTIDLPEIPEELMAEPAWVIKLSK